MLLCELEEALREIESTVARHPNADAREVPGNEIAFQRFSRWMAQSRILFGLARRVLAGRSAEVRSLVRQSLRDHGIPDPFTAAIIERLSAPRVVLGLARRRIVAGAETVRALVITLIQDHVSGFAWSAGEPVLATPAEVRRLLPRLLDKERVNLEWHKQVICAGFGIPEISIIVPFYRDGRFIDAMTTMQLIFERKNIEWIFVCDDPSLSMQMKQYLNLRRSFLQQRTILIVNKANYGYSSANAIGVKESSGELLLFMNSDVWIDNCVGIDIAAQALRQARFGIVGFRLLYEDGTIQHDGIQFKRSPYLHNLFILDHPGKGLPPMTPSGKLVRPVEAVTGALMMMRRELFSALGGFSQIYLRGDFEDGDLCLKAACAGHAIGLVATNGCYHLERQSIRLMGAERIRSTVTYINCIKFNDIWEDYLSRTPSVPAPIESTPVRALSGALT